MKIKLWDLPTRICHWTLAAAVAGAFVTQAVGGNAMVWHGRFGLAVLGLVVFRLVWGFAGSTYARFASFLRGPTAVRAYLQGRWQGVGHNPLGAFSVLALLALMTWLACTGLFANDDISFNGPLYALADKDLSDTITALHTGAEPVLILLVALHVGAIAFYARVKKQNLLLPMLTGWKNDAPADAESAKGGGPVALLVALVIAGTAVWVASGGCLPPPPPPVETPSW